MQMKNYKTFFKYVIPSVLAFALSGVYTIVDGLFVGNVLGDIGLATVNLSYPVAAFIQALGTGIGLAGAIQFTIFNARGDTEKEREYLSGTILLLLITSVVITGLFVFLADPLLRLLGAEGDILSLAKQYVGVIAIGAVFQVFATGLIPFIRNMGGATFAMLFMITGFVTNIILDYLFIWVYGWGVTGAALATIMGQGVTLVGTIFFLCMKRAKLARLSRAKIFDIFGNVTRIAFAPFGLTFSPIITIIFMNRFLMSYGGSDSVAVYACISYVTAIVYLLLQGVGDGSQPLISRYYGENAVKDVKQIRSLSYKTGMWLAIACMVGLFVARNDIGRLFGASDLVSKDVALILPLFLGSIILLSFIRVTTSYLYATEKSRLSYILVYMEPLLLLVLLFALPPIVGLSGVWVAVPLSQIATWVLAVVTKHRVDIQATRTA